jgi:3-oxoacyl-(acyl-carrier-protein) synthase
VQRSPWSTRLTALLTLDVWQHANLFDRPLDPSHIATIAAGHNFNQNYAFENYQKFQTEPDFIDPLFSLHTLDSDHAATASELIQSQGPLSTMGGACASGALAIRNALDEIRYHGSDACLVIGPVYDMAPPELQSLCQMGAVSIRHFNQEPSRASRPFDRRREGFVPAHGGAAMVLESLESAQNRGASIYGEILGVAATSDANHLPIPSEAGQIRTLQNIFAQTGVRPEQIDFVSAHATSTPLGDSVEVSALQKVFGPHARRLKINAPKSLLGHTCWSSAIVELVAAVLQINRGILHPSINIEELDPGNDLDVCANVACPIEANYLLKNSFGFGGVNSAILVKKFLAP